jgi:hypothetical protein
MKQTARIENWERCTFPGADFLAGQILDHPRQEEFHTDIQRTSRILTFDEAAGICETRNTIYKLGKKRNSA